MRRLVVVAPNWLGDAVMALPALADVRRHFPDASLHVAARPSVAPIYALVPWVDAVVALPPGGGWHGLVGAAAQAKTLAAGAYEAVILLPNSFASALIGWRAGIPERWGFATDVRARLLTRAIPRARTPQHQADYYQALTTALGIPPGPQHARIEVPAASIASARALLADAGVPIGTQAVVFAPGAAYGRAKQWVPERFAELATLLLAEGIVPVLVGSGADRRVCREIVSIVRRAGASAPATASGNEAHTEAAALRPSAVVDLSGRTDLPTLAGVLALAGACVSNDSGAMHLAAAAGANVVAIFGATDERRTAPLAARPDRPRPRVVSTQVWCRPCMLRECPIDHRCMTRISARTVHDVLRDEARGGQTNRVALDILESHGEATRLL
ncbi:MAG: lipopolysaccharide heptosyltransferase II [Acidobacteria bacterium]|nr:lipopolysaccharide heptosyltransferase II [Acidobacteriota bacterium]